MTPATTTTPSAVNAFALSAASQAVYDALADALGGAWNGSDVAARAARRAATASHPACLTKPPPCNAPSAWPWPC